MDIEHQQAEAIDYFVKQAESQKGASLGNLIAEATSHPLVFGFSEILSVPSVLQLHGTEHSVFLDLLRLFAHGTWSDYKNNAGHLPPLGPDQVRKLKQLSVLTLAEIDKVLPYDRLMQEIDVSNVRELEDFLINDCMYAGIVRGKLDQLRRCFEVQFAAGRDLRPEQLGGMIQTIETWLSTSDNLLLSIQEKIKWADAMNELDKKHQKEVEDKVEDVKKTLSLKTQTFEQPIISSIKDLFICWKAVRWKSVSSRFLWRTLPFVIIWVLWPERNARIFRSKWKRKSQLISDIIGLWWWCGSIRKIFIPSLEHCVFSWHLVIE